jgi:hypothetical protein
MSLDEKFIPVRTAFHEVLGNFFTTTAGLFGYPDKSWNAYKRSNIPPELYSSSNGIC